ncbi:MAG: FHA domain-containing protein [Deltaproteobacteria bacterium]|nr:MAG: FHA domain-containing protein [Deltaproteobacteria bacterium]
MATTDGASSERVTHSLPGAAGAGVSVRTFALAVEDGVAAGTTFHSTGPRCAIGSHPANDLTVDDPTVSSFHCEITADRRGARVRDLGSRNGTSVDGVRVADAWLRRGSRLRVGRTTLRFEPGAGTHQVPLSDEPRFGPLVGASIAMREAFALLARAAQSDVTVLLEGETGTGKEGAARGVHDASARRAGPFVVVDCGAIPANLLESELFGHVRGAFTGADSDRAGAFREADGGTLFLDEIGELPVSLQPKLLRAIEQRHVRPIGADGYRDVDIRLVAATHRDLRADVNAGRFRADLYYRLAVVHVKLPPLRERPEDIPLLVEHILDRLTDAPDLRAPLLDPDAIARLQREAWPGNVRELRNYIERSLVLGAPASFGGGERRAAAGAGGIDVAVPYAQARQAAIDRFERDYVAALLAAHDGVVSRAARAAGMNRAYLYRLIQRHGLRAR